MSAFMHEARRSRATRAPRTDLSKEDVIDRIVRVRRRDYLALFPSGLPVSEQPVPHLAEHQVDGMAPRKVADHGLAAHTHAGKLESGRRVRVIDRVSAGEEVASLFPVSLLQQYAAEIHENDGRMRGQLRCLAAEFLRLPEIPAHADAETEIRKVESDFRSKS